MPSTLFTFRDAAEIFCKVDGRSDSEVSGVYLQVKGLYDRGLLTPEPVRGARGANQISFTELCRARLLLILLELGIQSDDLQHANAQLDSGGKRTPVEGGPIVAYNLETAISASDLWVLAVNMGRDRVAAGKLTFSVKMLPAAVAALPITEEYDGPAGGGDPTHPDSQVYFMGVSHLAYVKVPASKLFGDLKSAIDA